MAQLITPGINRIYKQKIEQLIADLSQRSSFVPVTERVARCTNCVYDAASKCSTGRYNGTGPRPFDGKTCPVCNNKGSTVDAKGQKIDAIVKWGPQDTPDEPGTGGQLQVGQAKIKTYYRYKDLVEGATYYLVDGKRCKVLGHTRPRGLLEYAVVELVVQIDK